MSGCVRGRQVVLWHSDTEASHLFMQKITRGGVDDELYGDFDSLHWQLRISFHSGKSAWPIWTVKGFEESGFALRGQN